MHLSAFQRAHTDWHPGAGGVWGTHRCLPHHRVPPASSRASGTHARPHGPPSPERPSHTCGAAGFLKSPPRWAPRPSLCTRSAWSSPRRALRISPQPDSALVFVAPAPDTEAAPGQRRMNELTRAPGDPRRGRGGPHAGPAGTEPRQPGRGVASRAGRRARAPRPSVPPPCPHSRARPRLGRQLRTSAPGAPSRRPTRPPLAAAQGPGSRSSSFRPVPWGPPAARSPQASDSASPAPAGSRLGSGRKTRGQMEAPGKQRSASLPPPRGHRRPTRVRGRRPGARGGARAALTAAARPRWRAAQAWPPPEPAARVGKERPEPSGSLPWDTSCSALGPGRSPHLSGSLLRPRAEVCAGVDIRHPWPGRAGAPRPSPPRARPASQRARAWAAATRGGRPEVAGACGMERASRSPAECSDWGGARRAPRTALCVAPFLVPLCAPRLASDRPKNLGDAHPVTAEEARRARHRDAPLLRLVYCGTPRCQPALFGVKPICEVSQFKKGCPFNGPSEHQGNPGECKTGSVYPAEWVVRGLTAHLSARGDHM